MTPPLIRDIPSIKTNLELMRGIKTLNTLMFFLKPLFRILSIDVSKVADALSEMGELEKQVQELASIPDRFNDLLSLRGWIIYDAMNLEVAKEVILIAESGDIDKAEGCLLNYYNSETLGWNLMMMNGVRAFRLRMPLAEKALIDYREERYHASTPLVLALLDGLVNDLHEKQIGFFAQNANLEAWDSVAGHSKGLETLANLFRAKRPKTTTDPISIPFRNGILHGRDLGYDNKLVAAKTWAALFATKDWDIKAEQGMLLEQPAKPEKTWGELSRELIENSKNKKLLEAWEPREIQLGRNFPITGEPYNYMDGTPEQALVEFICYWRVNNYGCMAGFLLSGLKESPGKDAGRVRSHYCAYNVVAFEIIGLEDIASAVTEIQVRLRYENNGAVEREATFRMINEDAEGNIAPRNKFGSKWRVANWGAGVK